MDGGLCFLLALFSFVSRKYFSAASPAPLRPILSVELL